MKSSGSASAYLDLTDSETEVLSSIASMFTMETLSYHCGMLQDAFLAMNRANAVRRITAELTLVKMCDERLNSSAEAMLSRISAMEASIATGSFAVSAPAYTEATEKASAIATAGVAAENTVTEAAKPTRPQRRAPVADDDDDMFRGDAPGAAPAASTPQRSTPVQKIEPAPVSRPTAATASAPSGNVRVLKPYRSRAEAIERMEAASPMQSSFFKQAKWYVDEQGGFVLKFQNQFEIDNMLFFDGEPFFLKFLSQIVGRPLTKKDLVCECEATKKKDDVIDQILEAAEEN
jgi:hypothetical protein